MKRKIQALILSIVLMLTGCTYLYHINTIYPWSRAEIWHCEEIEMTIHFSLDESGKLTGETYSRFKLDGSLYDVRIGVQQSAIWFMHLPYTSPIRLRTTPRCSIWIGMTCASARYVVQYQDVCLSGSNLRKNESKWRQKICV